MIDEYSPYKRSQRLTKYLLDVDKVILLDVLALEVNEKETYLPPSPFPSSASEEEVFISSITEDENNCNLLDISISESLFENERLVVENKEEEKEKEVARPKIKKDITLGSILTRKDYKTNPDRTGSRLSKIKFKNLAKNMVVTAKKDVVRITFFPKMK